jgi:hypothetical protein
MMKKMTASKEERRRYGIYTKEDVSPPTESCGYEPGNPQMGPRGIEPSTGQDTNPMFVKSVPDASRYGPDAFTPASQRDGEKKLIARLILQGGGVDNIHWAYDKVHRCLLYLDTSGVYTDYTGGKHQQGKLPYPMRASIPGEPCQIIAVPSSAILDMDSGSGQLGRLADMLQNVERAFKEHGEARDDVTQVSEDYKRSAAKADIKETSTHLTFTESDREHNRKAFEQLKSKGDD